MARSRATGSAHGSATSLALVAALASPRERVAAATALLDRAWGKPTQHLAGDAASGPLTSILFEWAPAASAELVHAHPAINGDAVVEFAESGGDIALPRASG
jgi:hypothetical protein